MKNSFDHIAKIERVEPSPFLKTRIFASAEHLSDIEKPKLQWGVVLVICTLFFGLNLVAVNIEKQNEKYNYLEYTSLSSYWYAQ